MPLHEPVPGLADDAGIRAAYAAHGEELYRFALRLLGDAGLAEEVVQETFVRAWRASASYDPLVGSLRTWLFAIARNLATDSARARAVRPRVAADPDLDGASPHPAERDHAEFIARAWQIEEALGHLSPDHRQALVETYLRDRPRDQVATELGVPEGTLRSRVFYALKSLRVALEGVGWTDDER